MNKIIRTGLIGYGLGGRCFHAPFIATNSEYELARVVERKTNESVEKYPSVQIARSVDELLADNSIDLIVVTTPNETHFPFAKQALNAGKHVVVDKPMTVTSKEAAELIALSSQTQKVLSVYQNRRYASDNSTIRKIVDEKVLGDIFEFESQFNRFRPELKNSWKETPVGGSGILYDLGAHLIDQVFTLFGLPKSITADIRKQRPGTQADDYFDIRLDYGFTKAIMKAGMLVREQGPRFMIHGTEGSFIKYGDDPQDPDARAGKMPTDPTWGLEPPESYGLLNTTIDGKEVKRRVPSEKGDFGIFYRNLANTILRGVPLVEKPEHGFNVVRLIELAIESHQQKRTLDCTGFWETKYE
ncbi:MAG: oxidoreductase [Chitinophagaceae bacterium]|nr:oxidoreductase [Chitinophagaceae bacterium]